MEQWQTSSYPCKELQCTVHQYSVLLMIHNVQLSQNFDEKKYSLPQTQEKTFPGSDVGTLEAFAIENSYADL